MALPSDLVTHYSTKALQTRLAALGFIGAVLSANVVWREELIRSDTLGIGLLLVVGSLAELNRRYTYSYLCPCRASARSESPTQMWRDFTIMSEWPWSSSVLLKDKRKQSKKSFTNWASRFLLSWGTYLPGVVAGLYLAWSKFDRRDISGGQIIKLIVANLIAAALVAWWGVQSGTTFNPELILKGSLDQGASGKGQQAAS